jgi:hypothetical protein
VSSGRLSLARRLLKRSLARHISQLRENGHLILLQPAQVLHTLLSALFCTGLSFHATREGRLRLSVGETAQI